MTNPSTWLFRLKAEYDTLLDDIEYALDSYSPFPLQNKWDDLMLSKEVNIALRELISNDHPILREMAIRVVSFRDFCAAVPRLSRMQQNILYERVINELDDRYNDQSLLEQCEHDITYGSLIAEVDQLIHRKENRFNDIGELGAGGATFGERLNRTLVKHLGKREAKKTTIKNIKGENQ